MASLRSYQKDAVSRILSQPGTMLMHDMGAGKSLTSLTAIQALKLMGAAPAVVVGTKRINITQRVWEEERTKWGFNLSVQLVHDGKGADVQADVYTVTYDQLHRDDVQALLKRAEILVLDESSYLKAFTRRFKSLRNHKFKHVIELTGTPAPNGLLDLFYQVQLLDGGERFGKNKDTFKRKYFYPTDYNGYKWAPLSEDAIYDQLGDLVHRVEMTDLPDVLPQHIDVPMNPAQQKAYTQMLRTFITEVESGEVTAANAAVKANKLRQIAAGFLYDEDMQPHWYNRARTDTVVELMQEIGKPCLLVYEFEAQRRELETILGCKSLDDEDAINEWNEGKLAGLILHAKSGAHGLNLQYGGCHVIWMSLTWSWELWSQLNARLARPGQESEHVWAHICQSPGTIEQHVYNVIVEKGETEMRLLDWAARMTE